MVEQKMGEGALPSQTILELIKAGHITGTNGSHVSPASLDLSLSDEIYAVDGIFQPLPHETVKDVLAKVGKKRHDFNLPLVCGQTYLARLNEKLNLPADIYGYCNPKSTSGRLDVHVRLLADGVPRYDAVTPSGFSGELWLSIIPKTFPVKVSPGQTLNQLRLFNADTRLNDDELINAIDNNKLLWTKAAEPISYQSLKVKDNDRSIILTLDLEEGVIGYEGVHTSQAIDLSLVGAHDAATFFRPIKKTDGTLFLKRGEFYILSTLEAVRVPPELACEMVPMDERSGEFRSHYAGFIDPGWGWGGNGEGQGRTLTLEVRPFEDLIVRHGQPIAKIKFERMKELPEVLYDKTNSNYVVQKGPKLAKQFKP
jgi:dCTP deaminase